MAELSSVFNKCLSHQINIRSQGELELKSFEENPNFPIILYQYFTNPQFAGPLAQFAAVAFKNFIIKKWSPEEGAPILDEVKVQIRRVVFGAMLTTQPAVSSQLRESIAHIASHDFPTQWPELLDYLYQGLNSESSSREAIHATLQTCHKLFKRYRFSFRSDELWLEIKLVVDRLFQVYYAVAQNLFTALQGSATHHEINQNLLTFVPLLKVFISLNGQDVPQQFDDTLKEWMTLFHYLLTYHNQLLTDDTILFDMKSKILKCLTLYAQKYDEDFEPYVENFCKTVWELLSAASGRQEYDKFISASLDFFRVVTYKPQIATLMHSNLGLLFGSLILPNMIISEADEDLAEAANNSNTDFIKMYLEDANEDTRRSACTQLMRALIKQFPEDINRLVFDTQTHVSEAFRTSPQNNWKQMDALILLLSGLFPLLYTAKNGASSISTSPQHICQLFENFVQPQLANPTAFPILKTSCLKFIYVYRNQFPREMFVMLLNQVSGLIDNQNALVSSYAAATLERLLMVKVQEQVLLMNKEHLAPCLKQLLQCLANASMKHPRNLYIMNAFFRVIWLAQDTFSAFAIPACDIFIEYVRQVMGNPTDSDPKFNWLVFECFALVMMNSRGPTLDEIEGKLEVFMALIIQKSNAELLPYAFQIQALFIRLKRGLSQTNMQLLSSVLPMNNWEAGSRYYAPTLVIFLESVLRVQPELLVNNISDLVAIVKQLFVINLDAQAFSLATTVVETYPAESVLPLLREIYVIIFTKLHSSKAQNIRLSQKFHKGAIIFISLLAIRYGTDAAISSLNTVQQGIFEMLIKGEVIQNLRSVDTIIERRWVAIGMTNILAANALSAEVWGAACVNLLKMMEIPTNIASGTIYNNGSIDLPEENTFQMGKDSFQKIYSAELPLQDKFPDFPNEKMYFLQTVTRVPQFYMMISPYLDENSQQILQLYSRSFGIPIV